MASAEETDTSPRPIEIFTRVLTVRIDRDPRGVTTVRVVTKAKLPEIVMLVAPIMLAAGGVHATGVEIAVGLETSKTFSWPDQQAGEKA